MLLIIFISIYLIIGLAIGVLAAYSDYNVKPQVAYGWFMALFWLPAFLLAVILMIYSQVYNFIEKRKGKRKKKSGERKSKM